MDDDALVLQEFLILCSHRHLVPGLKAVQMYALCALTDSCTCYISSDVSAADDHYIAGELLSLAECDVFYIINAADDSLGIVARDSQLTACLETCSYEEALESFFTERLECNVLTDFNAASDLNTHSLENLDLSIYNLLVESEVRDTECHHSARHLLLLEYYRLVAFNSEEVCAGQSCRAGSYDTDLLLERFSCCGYHWRDVLVLILEILCCDERLDIVDSKGFINRASCALELAVLVADSAAYCRERVVSLDQLEGFLIFASACHINVTLDSNVKRARSLTRCSTCRPCLDYAVLILVVPVPLILRPYIVARKFLFRVFDLAVLCAELLTESDSAGRADFYALAASYALLSIYL